MSAVSRSFHPVKLLPDGQCANHKWHFRGVARETFSYLLLHASKHGGFIFASVDDIARHTKLWKQGQIKASKRQVERVLRIFRALHILGDYETRVIHGRAYRGWQFNTVHTFWATARDGVCEFKFWAEYENKQRKYMGNQDVVVPNDGHNDGHNDGDFNPNDGHNDGGQTDVSEPNLVAAVGL